MNTSNDPLLAVYVYLLNRAKAREKALAGTGELVPASKTEGHNRELTHANPPNTGGLTHA